MATETVTDEADTSATVVPTDHENLTFQEGDSFRGSKGRLLIQGDVDAETVIQMARKLGATFTTADEYFVIGFTGGPRDGAQGNYTAAGLRTELETQRS